MQCAYPFHHYAKALQLSIAKAYSYVSRRTSLNFSYMNSVHKPYIQETRVVQVNGVFV